MLLELPGVYPNGIAFDASQRLYWTESMAHRIRRLDDRGEPETFCQLSDGHVPDGMAFAADGRLFVATTISGGVTVISPDGEVLTEIHLDEHATNCIFDGSVLYVTATKVPDIEASQRTGSFWRVQTDATGLDADPREPVGPWFSRTRGRTCTVRQAQRLAGRARRPCAGAWRQPAAWPVSQPARGAGCPPRNSAS